MTDRELLELAAEAAGYGIACWDRDKTGVLVAVLDDGHTYWQPLLRNTLTDCMGDALRLAVKLNIPVYPYDDETSTGTIGVVAKNWGSKEANTRRAIVRAAAEIGRSMK